MSAHKESRDGSLAQSSLASETFESFVHQHGVSILAVARRYARCSADADDVFQLTLEAVFTKRPTGDFEQLAAWAKVVARNYAISDSRRRSREVAVDPNFELTVETDAADLSERLALEERDAQLSQAVRRLRPEHARCLLLKADGLDYTEIAGITGFSYTKVNRYLSDGRKALRETYARIDGGSECARLSGALSAYADGECDEARTRDIRLHLSACLACRHALREYRAAPHSVASAFPVGFAAVQDAAFVERFAAPFRKLGDAIQSTSAAIQEQFVTRPFVLQQLSDLSGAKHAAAVVGVGATLVAAGAGIGQLSSDAMSGQGAEPASAPTAGAPFREIPPVLETKTEQPDTARTESSPEKPREAQQADVEHPELGEADRQLDIPDSTPDGLSAPADDSFGAPSSSDTDPSAGTDPDLDYLAP